MINSIPHPLTPVIADHISRSNVIRELHPEVVSSRYADASTTQVIPAFFLLTEKNAFAVVENEHRDGYRILSKGSVHDQDAVYADLDDWCEQHGYLEQ
ncbi:hypothetical protein [Natronorubrum halophilum]|uniref:hypothetical protein n=1 Tax=Natronorubrum halophilum TaxID=1702106 RepID=UPI000EF64085|nr:hypothetical protein [Natronorubrum halophilum]